jgi:hypothetical protein
VSFKVGSVATSTEGIDLQLFPFDTAKESLEERPGFIAGLLAIPFGDLPGGKVRWP